MIDLANWNLTIPEQTPSAVIDTATLNRGYHSPYFVRRPDGSLVFWAPVTGTHTENAHYPRSELRETLRDGSRLNWHYPEAENQLRAELAVNQVPSSGKVIVGQIHGSGEGDGDNANPLVKLQYRLKDGNQGEPRQVGQIEALLRDKPGDDKSQVQPLIRNVPLNAHFTYQIHLSATGRLTLTASSAAAGERTWSTQVDPGWQAQGLYFKAGAYVQDNKGPADEGGKATFYQLTVEHRPN